MLTTLPPSCAVVMKSGSLNFLEPSGPVQACNGTALPLLLEDPFVPHVEFRVHCPLLVLHRRIVTSPTRREVLRKYLR